MSLQCLDRGDRMHSSPVCRWHKVGVTSDKLKGRAVFLVGGRCQQKPHKTKQGQMPRTQVDPVFNFCLLQTWKRRVSGELQASWGWSACPTWRADPIQTGESMLLGIFNSFPSTYKESLRSWNHDSQSGARQNSRGHKLKQNKRKFFLRGQSGSGEAPPISWMVTTPERPSCAKILTTWSDLIVNCAW